MKERLTGAIILVALIVLLVPELLTGPVSSAPRAAGVASATEEPPLRSYTIKLADEPHASGASPRAGPEQPAPLPSAPESPAASATAAPPPAAPESGEPPAAGAAARSTGAAPAAGTPAGPAASGGSAPAGGAEPNAPYVVQLGSFASHANAERLAKQVRAQGFRVSVSQGSSGRLYRVRVGPAHDRAAAAELAQQLRAHGHAGDIVPK